MTYLRPALVFLVLLASIGCAKADDLILQCKGTVSSFMSPLWTKDDQVIAVHVKNDAITFSGNDFLRGNDVRICPPGYLGTTSDEWFLTATGVPAGPKTCHRLGNTGA